MKRFNFKLTVDILKQDKRYIAYSPALDLSTSGKSETEVKKRFGEAAIILIQELDKAGTINEVLEELGWRRIQKKWQPPKIISQEPIEIKIPVAA